MPGMKYRTCKQWCIQGQSHDDSLGMELLVFEAQCQKIPSISIMGQMRKLHGKHDAHICDLSYLQQGIGIAVCNLVLQACKARRVVALKIEALKAAAVQSAHLDLVIHLGQPGEPGSCPLLPIAVP